MEAALASGRLSSSRRCTLGRVFAVPTPTYAACVTRKQLDEAFPTFVRYCGVALTVALVVASILGHGIELAAGYVAAAGMILYKAVRGAANGEH